MKIKSGYKIRDIAGENIVVCQGTSEIDMTRIISLNKSAVLLWTSFKDVDFTVDQVADKLIEIYNIDSQVAANDAKTWCKMLQDEGLVE